MNNRRGTKYHRNNTVKMFLEIAQKSVIALLQLSDKNYVFHDFNWS